MTESLSPSVLRLAAGGVATVRRIALEKPGPRHYAPGSRPPPAQSSNTWKWVLGGCGCIALAVIGTFGVSFALLWLAPVAYQLGR